MCKESSKGFYYSKELSKNAISIIIESYNSKINFGLTGILLCKGAFIKGNFKVLNTNPLGFVRITPKTLIRIKKPKSNNKFIKKIRKLIFKKNFKKILIIGPNSLKFSKEILLKSNHLSFEKFKFKLEGEIEDTIEYFFKYRGIESNSLIISNLDKINEEEDNYLGKLILEIEKSKKIIIGSAKNKFKNKQLLGKFDIVINSPSKIKLTKVKIEAFKEIANCKLAKKKLLRTIVWPYLYKESFNQLNIKNPKGVLIYGPPGTGKTSLAKAAAIESGCNFVLCSGADIYSKYLGESEKAIRETFNKAKAKLPSIIFFDEIDSLVGKRGSSEGEVSDRVLSTLLNEMDGIESLNGVSVIGATNRIDLLDEALLRPGRFDELIEIPLPNFKTRKKIFQIKLPPFTKEELNMENLINKTEGCTGADIENLCMKAALKAIRNNRLYVNNEDFT